MTRDAVTQAQLRKARQAFENGDYAEAVRCLCAASTSYVCMVDMYRGRTLLPVSCFLECGVVFVNSETGLRAELRQSRLTRACCERLLTAVAECVQHPLRRTLCERLHAWLQSFSIQLMQDHRALLPSRLMLKLLHSLKYPLRRHLPHAHRRDEASALVIGLVLREPRSRVLVLLREQSRQAEQIFQRQRMAPHIAESFQWPEREDYRTWLRHNPGSRVLVTMHMGNYPGAFRCLAAEVETGRRVISLQREQQQDLMALHHVDSRLHHAVLPRTATSATAVVAALRGGRTTLAILADLGDRFGDAETVPFFGFPARLVRGPALLAILGRAPLVPFVAFEQDGSDHIRMAPVISAELEQGESLAQGVRRLTCLLAIQMESWIRMAPAQWRFLPAAGMFFNVPVSGDSANEH